jgi:hypothetical protein
LTAGEGGLEQERMEERLARLEEQLAEVLACLTRVEMRVGDLDSRSRTSRGTSGTDWTERICAASGTKPTASWSAYTCGRR